ncbi:hypothetical protein [Streptomyces sp. NBC_00344]|uniref:hypothetical protein n=1 Tax=Streptomyces sp. NBC_00344 TaxID=2975720 RepID=UPI002E1CAA71
MEAVIVILALLFLAFIGVGTYVTVKVVGAAKRGVDRTVSQARRSVEDTALRVKSYGQPGVRGELAQLRLSLRSSMRATQDALHAGVADDASLKESLGLFERLSTHGLELDAELRRLEREPDTAGLGGRLPALRERTEQITRSADALRWAARDRARRFATDDLTALNEQIDMEAGALRHWTAADGQTPATGTGRTAASGPGSSGQTQWPPADGRTAAGAPAQTWPEPAGDAGPSTPGEPEAITGRDRERPAARYPWQKTARPESTR